MKNLYTLLLLFTLAIITPQFLQAQSLAMVTRYYHAYVLRNHQLQADELWTYKGKIIAPQAKADVEIDAKGLILAPGYIDLQINGGFGCDFSSDPASVDYVAQQLPQYGVTAFLPTLVSSTSIDYQRAIPLLQPRAAPQKATILGIHLEGPFFCPKRYGAHNPHLLHSFDEISSIQEFYGTLEGVKIVTLAPELPDASRVIQELRSNHIVISAGHTSASYQAMQEAFKEGVTLITHLFNAMPSLHHREPGLITAALTHPNIFYSIIVDYIHVHPAVVNLAWRAHPEGLVLVTDAMEALGLPNGTYRLGTQEVEVEDGAAYIKGTKTIAGSVLSLDQAVRQLRQATGCSLVEAIEAASWKPAKVLGIDNTKGTLEVGADADFILLDKELNIQATYIGGELAWENSQLN